MMEPLVPTNVDLRDFAFMPIDVHRLLTSETWVLGTGDERAAAMTLWLVSWHQVPAGSLPDGDRMLAHLSQAKAWPRVKEHALRGWQIADDRRMYHPIVAEKVLEAWLEKLAQRLSSGAGNAKRWNVEFDPTPIEREMHEARVLLSALNPQSRTLSKKRTSGIPSGSKKIPDGSPKVIPSGIPSGSQETETETETGNKKLPPNPQRGNGADAPSGGVQADLVGDVDPASKPDPAQPILDAYHQLLPKCERVEVLNPKRRKRLLAAIKLAKSVCKSQGWPYVATEFWPAYFGECASDPWMRGEVANPKNPSWRQNLDVLLAEDRFASVMDRAIGSMREGA